MRVVNKKLLEQQLDTDIQPIVAQYPVKESFVSVLEEVVEEGLSSIRP